MSASSKKKLRKEQNAEQLTERQRREQAEAKKLRNNTVVFVVAMVLVVCIALGTVAVRAVNRTGIIDKSTIAAVVGDHELNSVVLNYFYNDAISETYNSWYSSYSTYTDTYVQMLYGLDLTKSLDSQVYDEEKGTTWADYFISLAIDDAKSSYAMYDKAMSENYEISEDYQTQLDDTLESTEYMATLYGYSNVSDYLQASYGYGSDIGSYTDYLTVLMTAYSYANDYIESLKYEDADLREHEAEHFDEYSSFTYNYYHLSYSSFLPKKETDESGSTTYTDEEKDAARAAAKEAAEALAKATSVEEFDKMIAELEINADKEDVASTKYEDALYSNVNSVMRDWIADSERQAGNTTVIESTTSGDDDETVITGYYVVYFQSRNDNNMHLANVRHLLVKFEGGTEDDDGNIVYTDAEKNKAKTEAEGYLKTWQEGEATEESFIELVKKNSDDSSAEDGGLFEDITPDSSYVENFLNWATDEGREAGDAEVIDTEYGYHVMYYVGDDELTYRDYMITEELKSTDYEAWYDAIVEDITATEKNTSRLNKDMILSSGSSLY